MEGREHEEGFSSENRMPGSLVSVTSYRSLRPVTAAADSGEGLGSGNYMRHRASA